MERRDFFARNMRRSGLLESFLVMSVTSVLVIRFYLAVTGYPQLGRAGLHIAHMLWGGLFMLVAIVLLLSFLGRRIQFLAACLGGIGFGTFIDELGKFITSDNNYFYQPTVALIYLIFLCLLFSIRELENRTYLSKQERLANIFDILKQGVLHDLHEGDKIKALRLLRSEEAHDPRWQLLFEIVEQMSVVSPSSPGLLARIANKAKGLYLRLIRSSQFRIIVISVFTGYMLLFTLLLLVTLASLSRMQWGSFTTSFVEICLVISTSLSMLLIVVGALFLKGRPLRAYRWFKRAVLVSICVTQLFMFYTQQLSALGEVAVNLVFWIALNYLIHQQHHQQEQVDTLSMGQKV